MKNPDFPRLSALGQPPLTIGYRLLSLPSLLAACILALVGSPAAFAAEGISENALQQISALQAEKDSRTPAQIKMDSQLVYLLKKSHNQPFAPGVTNLILGVTNNPDGTVLVDLDAQVSSSLLNAIVQAGGSIRASSQPFNSIRALVPLAAIENIAGRSDVRFVRPAVQAITRTGSVDSEGDVTHRADRARNRFGVTGAGVKVGVLSDSVDFLGQAQASGDLPANVTVLPGQGGAGAGEGTAMLEIVYDLAPGAQLFFASGFNGEAQFAQNILDLRSAGCDIIIDDIGYFDESPFQDSVVARAVNSVTADGALYFSSAGNEGSLAHGTSGTWEGDFVDGGPAGAPVNGKGGTLHSFGATAYDTATRSGNATVLLWSDPLASSTNDYDLYVLDSTGANVISSSTTVQNGSQDPFEIVPPPNNGERVVVVKAAGDPRFIHIDTIRGRLSINTAGNITGHAATTNAFACAAVDVHTAYPNPFSGGAANPVENFSTDGPRRVFYSETGVPITPGNFLATGGFVRQKPDITAADGVVTTLPPFSGLNPFFGTSAAAPHAGAIAALLKSYNPGLTPDQVRTILTSSALDIESPGFDVNAGFGIVMAEQALAIAPLGLNLIVVTNYISGGNGNGRIDPHECNDLGVVLQNVGTSGATNITANLSTTNSGVIIAQRTASFPDLPPGAAATNFVPFKISTSPSFVCGNRINCSLVVKTDQGSRTNLLVFDTGTNGAPKRFTNNIPVPIPDNNPIGASSPIFVSNFSDVVGKVTVGVHITHTFDADLLLQLISPDGSTFTLSANNGFNGDDYGLACAPDSLLTIFDDDANIPIVSGSPPFLGTYSPQQSLKSFSGKSGTNINGTWQLHVVDQAFIDVGTIDCWTLLLSPVSCPDGAGQCPGVDLAIGIVPNPEPVFVGSNLVYSISVTNFGPDLAKNTIMQQVLPPTVVYVSGSVSQGTISQSGGTVTAALGDMQEGAVATALVVVTPVAQGTLSSTATVSSSNPEFDPSNNSATAISHVNPPFSDLVVGLLGAPNPVLVGQTLTYTASVTNNGPAIASNVTLTNILPVSVGILSANPSQGFASVFGNIVVANFGAVTNGGRAVLTIQVVPSIEGAISASSTATASQVDPVPGNNTAVVNTIVGPSTDLALGLSANPASIVPGTNLTYTLRVTNRGPSVATGVVVNDSLPGGVTVIITNSSKGSIVVSGSVVAATLGSLTNGETATITIGVVTTNLSYGTLVDSANVSGNETDPNTVNNSASINVLVSPPTVIFAIDRARINSESLSPTNGTVDPGETVNVSFFIQNNGNIPNTGSGLLVTLLATNGVSSPSGTQNYGNIAPAGVQNRAFTFTADGTNGGTVLATFLLQDPSTNQILTFTFVLPKTQTFANTNRIDIPSTLQDQQQPGPADPYPSSISVVGVSGLVSKVTVTLSNLNHTFPHDINLLLVGPSGLNTVILSDAAADSSVSSVDLTFDDFAPSPLPSSGQISSGSWQPSAYDSLPAFSSPAPAGPYGTALSVYNGPNPNGSWALYANDDNVGDYGSIAGGWSLSFTTVTPVNQIADLIVTGSSSASAVFAGDIVTNTFTVTNAGPNNVVNVAFSTVLPPGVTFVSAVNSVGTAISTAGSTLSCSLGSVAPGGPARTVSVAFSASSTAALTNTAAAFSSSGEVDLTLANNSVAQVVASTQPSADLAVTSVASPDPVMVGSNLTVSVSVTNAGPHNALNVVVSNAIPAGTSLVSPNASQGVVTIQGVGLVANLGTISPASSATVNFVLVPISQGLRTNITTASTTSTDPNPANNSSTVTFAVVRPSPVIQAAGAVLLSESISPPNAAIDSGEIVTVSLALTNAGPAGSTNLDATLLAINGVNSPSGNQNYGTLLPGTAAAASFTFTAGSPVGGVILATLQLHDAFGYSNNVVFAFTLPATTTFSNVTTITIPDHGSATPYPSTISVSGLTGVVDKVSVTLNGLSHGFPDDLDIMLVSPSGQKLMLMSDCGGGHPVTNLSLTFDDSAASKLPDSSKIASGTYQPTDFELGDPFPPPAPAGQLAPTLASFSGIVPNGTWSLYVVDDSNGDAGSISAGWTLSLTTISTVNPAVNLVLTLSDAPDPVLVASALTYTFTLTNRGPSTATNVVVTDFLPPGLVVVSSNISVGSLIVGNGTVIITNVSLAAASGLSATLRVSPSVSGTFVNTATATSAQTDLDPASNTAQSTTTVLVPLAATLDISPAPGGQFQLTLTADPGQVYRLQGSSNFVTWVPVVTGTAAANGTFKFTTTNASSFGYRFFRSIRIP